MRPGSLGSVLGFVGGILILLGSVVTFFFGVAVAAIHHSFLEGIGATALALEQAVVAVILLFFTALAARRSRDYALAGGVVLLLVSLIGLVFLGGGVLIVIGFILTLIAGVLFVIPGR